MKKTLIAAAAAAALVAGQAAAANTAAPRVQDRVGGMSEGAAPAGAQLAGLPFAILFVAGFTAIAVASEDDSDSD
ncbi:MAG: hypothetical protein H2038_05480 [Brevundimonas sp.]|jgi:hypothetical protein|uniref:hypothetical protein n=1 Tax=Brevundimonas sp. TaxID=1871086 RepID=UPI0018252E08|nr:hypothetical protein [Brevundimonas sp.]MBA4804084.1 hypothetical protein [Brevundimonas sp.]